MCGWCLITRWCGWCRISYVLRRLWTVHCITKETRWVRGCCHILHQLVKRRTLILIMYRTVRIQTSKPYLRIPIVFCFPISPWRHKRHLFVSSVVIDPASFLCVSHKETFLTFLSLSPRLMLEDIRLVLLSLILSHLGYYSKPWVQFFIFVYANVLK